MKEDAQLICPLAYEDIHGVWDHLNKELSPHFPLSAITWKSPQASSIQVTINNLSVRCIPSGANLFKDTDHPFRWFLAPYVNLYVFVCDTPEHYKTRKAKLKQWIDSLSGPKRSSWLVIYLTMGNQSQESYQKIYAKLSNEIYFDKVGDRTAVIYCNASQSSRKAHATDVIEKVKEGIITSFYQRCSLYDSEIRRLDAMRGTAQLDFRQLFLVKESLALMFQMMQLPSEALLQYEELETLLAFAPIESLPDTDWPFVPFEASTQSKGAKSSLARSSSMSSESGGSDKEESNDLLINSSSDADVVPMWMCACQQGLALLRYSINHARMKVLKNQIGLLELQHYVFSRVCFFLFSVSKPAVCAERSIVFLKSIRSKIQNKFDAMGEKELQESKDDRNIRRRSSLEQLNDIMLDGKDSALQKEKFENLSGVSTSVHRSYMADLWLIVSAVQLTKKCRSILMSTLTSKSADASVSSNSHILLKRDFSSSSIERNVDSGSVDITSGNEQKASSSFFNDESVIVKSKALARHLIELLSLAKSKLFHLIHRGHNYRMKALDMARSFSQWNDFSSVVEKHHVVPPCDRKKVTSEDKSFCDPLESLEEAIGAFQKKIQTLMQYRSEFTEEELHSKADEQLRRASSGGLFVSNAEISELEANISVIMLRLLIENEEILSRWRFSCHSLLDSADILLTNGDFALAKIYLCAALDGTVFSPDSIISRNIIPQSTGTKLLWGQMRVWTIKKLLLCYRALDDESNFVLISLALLDPDLKDYISQEERVLLQQNITHIQNNSSVTTDMAFHFNCKIQLKNENMKSFSTFQESSHLLCPSMTLSAGSKSIRDEEFSVNIATCSGGETHCLLLEVTNNFPQVIVADEISLIYTAFTPVVVHGISKEFLPPSPPPSSDDHDSSVTNSTTNNNDAGDSSSSKSFSCHPFTEFYNSEGVIVLEPGVNVIALKFMPPCCGEFAPSEIRIKLNSSVTFIETINSDLNKLHQFFTTQMIIDVAPPSKALKISPFPSTVTPYESDDIAGMSIFPEATDIIKSLVILADCVPKKGRASYEKKRRDSVSLVSERNPSPAPENISHDKTSEDLVETKILELGCSEEWLFQCSALNELNHENDVEVPTVAMQKGGIIVSDIPSNVAASLKLGFKTLKRAISYSDKFEEYDLIFSVSGNIIRNGCTMDFQMIVEQAISVGNPLDIFQETTELFESEYFAQYYLRNITMIPWKIHSFNPIISEGVYSLVDGFSESDGEEAFILSPGECYNIAVQLRKKIDKLNIHSQNCGELDIHVHGSFPIQRYHSLNSNGAPNENNQIYQQYNNTVFQIPTVILPPVESPLVHSLDYTLEASMEDYASVVIMGEVIDVNYDLKILFPHSGLDIEHVILLLRFECTKQWAILGNSRKVVQCSPENNNISLGINLVAAVAGDLDLPPLNIMAFYDKAQLHAYMRKATADELTSVDIVPTGNVVHVKSFQPTTTIFSLSV